MPFLQQILAQFSVVFVPVCVWAMREMFKGDKFFLLVSLLSLFPTENMNLEKVPLFLLSNWDFYHLI